ncbi:hypothetical protein AAMO2058_000787400 [Amorphochlora amoebiformis]
MGSKTPKSPAYRRHLVTLVFVVIIMMVLNHLVSTSMHIAELERQIAKMASNSKERGVVSGWVTDGRNLPMSIKLAANIHFDSGDEESRIWTTIESPSPKPPPKKASDRKKSKTFYGGSQEADHVGGFLQNDTQSYEPEIWEFMVKVMGIDSVLDIGCGRGISTKWFLDHGCRVRCAEATDEGISTTVLPKRELITQHDYTQGPWWPQETFDAVWSVEFLEHVHEDYMDNWFATMRASHYVFTSHSKWGGHHHVAIHHDWWWIEKFASRGFEYLPELTEIVRNLSRRGKYVWGSGLVFRNTRNVRVKPMLGPGTGGQNCEWTKRALWGTHLLKTACKSSHWPRSQNPIIPWVNACKSLCSKIDY